MIDSKHKQKMISFRISAEEYASLKDVYRVHGARSLSDFARLAMRRLAGIQDPQTADLLLLIQAIDLRVGALEVRLSRTAAAPVPIAVGDRA